MLDWDDLRTFLAIARHGTLSAAARALGVHQPTMGRRLAALEQRAGARLLQKTPRGYTPTAAGESILGNVERIEAEALAVERRITGRDVRLEGVVRITTVESFAAEIVMPILAGLRQRHPGIDIELMAEVRNLNLSRREADVALRMARPDQADLTVRRIGLLGFGLFASPAYLDSRGMPDFDRGGEGHDLILTQPDLMTGPEMRWLTSILPRAAPALRTNSRYSHRAAALAGLGIACLARYLAYSTPLTTLLPPTPPPVRELWLAVHADVRHMPRIRAVTEALASGVKTRADLLAPAAGALPGTPPGALPLDPTKGEALGTHTGT
jgi:DNA-binding transcriptional LysR family regulator